MRANIVAERRRLLGLQRDVGIGVGFASRRRAVKAEALHGRIGGRDRNDPSRPAAITAEQHGSSLRSRLRRDERQAAAEHQKADTATAISAMLVGDGAQSYALIQPIAVNEWALIPQEWPVKVLIAYERRQSCQQHPPSRRRQAGAGEPDYIRPPCCAHSDAHRRG